MLIYARSHALIDCVSLADRVVRRAKERLDRRQKKHPNTIARPNRSEAELRLSVDHGSELIELHEW